MVEELDHCEKCHGCKVLHEEKIIDVAISPGSKTGNRIKFKGEGDQIVSVENLFPNMAKAYRNFVEMSISSFKLRKTI